MTSMNVSLTGMTCITLTTMLAMVGCGESRPEGMPETYPTYVTITQGGTPLADATVVLFPEDSTLARWPVGGMTDEQGTAEMLTSTKYAGAPAGTYKVIVNKTVTEGDPMPKHPGQGATRDQINEYDRALKTGKFEMYKVVSKEFRAAGTTTLSVEVSATGENKFTEDVGSPVKDMDAQATAASAGGTYTPMGTDSE
ncbi:carboxypeptidase regulatory-like domain-containing protein [Allorhodopirellula heiligendammensis]|uniref:Uncharacterized protein n=1 Tax=Allorhodopirellula heiligendammensis TaxID=2714739 RepID=A0A5C6C6F1_9BACT|nr:carboxypeptidase regulatory-like domain-containing protein [Allorhodopirellula heiligendammensis]TWU19632.1 hypothetical protein Poly21_18070 [Allorhodopirellula heiligendammensis]